VLAEADGAVHGAESALVPWLVTEEEIAQISLLEAEDENPDFVV
jgi:hypothetical protein